MDYSLLLGVHDTTREDDKEEIEVIKPFVLFLFTMYPLSGIFYGKLKYI